MEDIIRSSNDKGIALIIVLWMVVIFGSIAAASAYLSRLELRQAYYSAKEIQLIGAAMTGVEKVKIKLAADDGLYDSLKGTWNTSFTNDIRIGDVTVTIAVEDEESKLDLNNATPERLSKLPPLAQPVNANEMIDALIDWEDADAVSRPMGGEDEYYKSLKAARSCKNAPLDCIEEVSLIKGFGDFQTMQALKKIATVSTDGKININTAPVEVLMTLPKLDYLLAQAIIAHRNGKDLMQGTEDDLPYDTVQKLQEVVGQEIYGGLENLVSVKSSHFRVVVKAALGKYGKTVEALLYRQGRNVQLKYWKESF